MTSIVFDSLAISIHALRGEGDDGAFLRVPPAFGISIHALRGEGDVPVKSLSAVRTISIHALRGEGDSKNAQILFTVFL